MPSAGKVQVIGGEGGVQLINVNVLMRYHLTRDLNYRGSIYNCVGVDVVNGLSHGVSQVHKVLGFRVWYHLI